MAAITSTRERASSASVELRALPVDVDVDVPAQLRPRFAQAVAKPRPALLEAIERLVDCDGVDLEVARKSREERLQRRGQIELGHG